MTEQNFYLCKHCGNFAGMIQDSGVLMECCGEPMQKLEANTTDASKEKHLPVPYVYNRRIKITVGETLHPMDEDHYIQWIYVQTNKGGMRKTLKPGDRPIVEYNMQDENAVAVYAYCNLHGLWKTLI